VAYAADNHADVSTQALTVKEGQQKLPSFLADGNNYPLSLLSLPAFEVIKFKRL
jgi:hypothetical protein